MLAQPEAQHEQGDAEDECVGADPPSQDNGADERGHDQQRAIDDRNNPASHEPPAAVIPPELVGGRPHQPPDTIAQAAMTSTKARSVMSGQRNAMMPAAMSATPSSTSRPQRSFARAARRAAAIANAPSTSM